MTQLSFTTVIMVPVCQEVKGGPIFPELMFPYYLCSREMETSSFFRLQGRREVESQSWIYRPCPHPAKYCRKKPPVHMQGHAFMGKHETKAQEYAYGFRGRMDERYDMVRSVVGEKFIYIRNYMPHKPYGQHVSYMFQTPTTQVWKRMFDEGKLNEAQSHFWKTNRLRSYMTWQMTGMRVKNLVKSKEHAEIFEKCEKLTSIISIKSLMWISTRR